MGRGYNSGMMKYGWCLFLFVLTFCSPVSAAKKPAGRLEFLVDASASMSSTFGSKGGDRLGTIRGALDVLSLFFQQSQPDRIISLRIFGGGEKLGSPDSCRDTRLVENWTPSRDFPMNSVLDGITSLGSSPLEIALKGVGEDFGPIQPGDALIVFLDGLDSCGGDPFPQLDQMIEEGLAVIIVGLGLTEDDRDEITQHASLMNPWDETRLNTGLVEPVVGLSALELANLKTRISLKDPEGIDSLEVEGTMLPDTKTISAGKFPLSATLPAGSISVTALDEEQHSIGKLIRFPLLPGHDHSLQLPEKLSVSLEAESLDEGWDIQPSLDVRWSKAPTTSLRLVLTKDPAPGTSWIQALDVMGPEGHATVALPERSGPALLQLRRRGNSGEIVLAELALKSPGHWISIEAPSTWKTDSAIPVEWKSLAAPGDFLTIVPAAGGPEELGELYPASQSLQFDMKALHQDCGWEIRYISGLSNSILSRSPVDIIDPRAGLLLPDKSSFPATLKVHWWGPGERGDILTIATEDSEPTAYLSWTAADRSPSLLEAPSDPGLYLVRYLDAGSQVLAEDQIEIVQSTVVLWAPEDAKAGGRFKVSWTGSRSPEDYIVLVSKGAKLSKKIDFFYVSMGSPSSFAAPEKAGAYELRYFSAGEVLATREILVR